jgi:glucose-1-phosphate thymidylyltransferase
MKILILAGGFATRLWPLSEKHAKPLLLLSGKTILEHLLDQLPENSDAILLTNSKFATDFEMTLSSYLRNIKVEVFREDAHSEGEKLGALGALSAVIQEYEIDDNLLILAGDNLLPGLEIAQLFCDENEARIAVREVETVHEARQFGVIETEKVLSSNNLQKVVGFEEKPAEPKSTLVSTGFMSIGKNLLPILVDYARKAPDALGGIFPELLRLKKNIFAVPAEGEWFDIGSFETYLAAHKSLQKESCTQGKRVNLIGENQFLGKVFLGDRVEIENCSLTNTIVYPGSILRDCIISNSVIDESCSLVGLDLNQKIIRSGTVLVNE